ncbi:MAG: SMP-30/gluconolactonase/LRE family protein [Planctomycetes bacterium]|nr:SMP-30/gluconolactonase/LRE family protein [Planctomycetota bacterium]MBI3843620.1 SMP-30/gluconolactonase/LRE family protein [Planctomycetota bacterium]
MTGSNSLLRGRCAILVAAILAGSGIASGQGFTSTHIPTVPRSLGAAVSDDNRWLYTLSSNNVIGVIDTTNDRFVAGIDLNGVAINPSGVVFSQGKLYVESYDHIVVVDTTTRAVSRVLSQPFMIGQSMGDVDLSPDGQLVYAVSGSSDSLSIIDTRLDEVVGTVVVGRNNTDLAISPDGTRAYVINSYDATVTVVDLVARQVLATTSFVQNRPFLNLPAESAMRSDGLLYVAWVDPAYLAHVSRIEADGRLRDIFDETFYSTGIAFALDEQDLLLGGGYVVDANTGALVTQIPATSGISKVVFAPNGARAYVTNSSWLHVLAIGGFHAMLTTTGQSVMGGTMTLNLLAPSEHGRMYQVGLSASTNQGIPMLNGEVFPLDRDTLFRYSMRGTAEALSGFTGHLGADGRGTATIRLSNAIPGCAVGQTIYVAFGTFTGTRRTMTDVAYVSNVVAVPILP